MVNWQINVYDLLAIIGAGLILYGRLVTVETKIAALWEEYLNRNKHRRV